jgi:hypothetical protein
MRLGKALRLKYGDKARIVLPVHDETNLVVHSSIPVEEIVSVVRESMEIKPNLFPGWGRFPVTIQVGSGYGDLHNLEDWSTVKADSCPVSVDLKEEAKPESPSGSPSLVVTLPGGSTDDLVKSVKDILDNAAGNYTLYFEIGGMRLRSHSHRINPSELILEKLRNLGVKVTVTRPAGKVQFDPSSLQF